MYPTTGALRFWNYLLYQAHYRASVHKFLTLLSGSEGQGWMSPFLCYFPGKHFPSNGYSACVCITSEMHCGHSWIRNRYQPTSEIFSCDDVLFLVLLWGAYETKEWNSCSCVIPERLSWPQRFSLLVMGKMRWQHWRRNGGFQSLLLPSSMNRMFRPSDLENPAHFMSLTFTKILSRNITPCLREKKWHWLYFRWQKHQKTPLHKWLVVLCEP